MSDKHYSIKAVKEISPRVEKILLQTISELAPKWNFTTKTSIFSGGLDLTVKISNWGNFVSFDAQGNIKECSRFNKVLSKVESATKKQVKSLFPGLSFYVSFQDKKGTDLDLDCEVDGMTKEDLIQALAQVGVSIHNNRISRKELEQKVLASIDRAEDLVRAIEDVISKHFPNFVQRVNFGVGISPAITIKFADITEEQAKSSNVAFLNAPHNLTALIFNLDKDGSITKPLSLECGVGPRDPKLIKKTGTPDAILKHLDKFFSKLKAKLGEQATSSHSFVAAEDVVNTVLDDNRIDEVKLRSIDRVGNTLLIKLEALGSSPINPDIKYIEEIFPGAGVDLLEDGHDYQVPNGYVLDYPVADFEKLAVKLGFEDIWE